MQALGTLQLYFCFPYLCTISAWVCPELPYPLSFHSSYFSIVFVIMLLFFSTVLYFCSFYQFFTFIWWNTYKLQFSRYLVAFSMMWYLNQRVMILPPRFEELQFGGYLKSGEWLFLRCVFQDSSYLINKLTSVLCATTISWCLLHFISVYFSWQLKGSSNFVFIGGFLIGRTLSVLFTMTLATSMAARQGAVAMAGHQICLQVWLAVSLLTDALAASAQVNW